MDVKLPNLGEGADSGTVVGILVKPGAQIKKGQNIIELETGKAVAPIPSPAAGTVTTIRVKEGDKLSVGGVILSLDEAAGATSTATAAPAAAPAKKSAPKPAAKKAAPEPEPEDEGEVEPGEAEVVNENPVAPPSVRRVARELGIDLRKIPGDEGRVTWEDLRNYIARLERLAAQKKAAKPGAAAAAPAEPVDFSQWGSIYKRPVTQLRKVIAQRMTESRQTIPEVTQFDEADVTVLNDLRKKFAPEYEKKGARLTLTSFVLKAIAATLKKHPAFNASLDEMANEVVFKEYIHLGLAVDTEAGLLVPVIRDADKKDLVQLSKDIADVAAKARDRKLGVEEMRGGSFTISNQGGIGGAHFTPIINKPEVAILGLGRSVLKPVVREGKIEPRLMMPMAVAYDHRVIDGGAAARFTVDLVAAFEKFTEADVKI
ncbi:MAG TPA: 2-oxo acid dehydrogenase subunit E2 [Verrucomicrobiae bacterium]|jgi:pyruvate dehydrogenase E2 component (dihydrolipoamide acetyltransferase)